MELNELKDYVRQNVVLSNKIKELTKIQAEIKKTLIEEIKASGHTTDEGHVVIDFSDEVDGVNRITHQRRVSTPFDAEVAEELLTAKGLHNECLIMVPQLDEGKVLDAFQSGKLTEEDIDAMFPAKVVWAFVMS